LEIHISSGPFTIAKESTATHAVDHASAPKDLCIRWVHEMWLLGGCPLGQHSLL